MVLVLIGSSSITIADLIEHMLLKVQIEYVSNNPAVLFHFTIWLGRSVNLDQLALSADLDL